jgi:hypothetical protein
MTDLTDRLDEAIAHRLAGHLQLGDKIDPLLTGLDQLEALRDVPRLDIKAAAQGKQVFLTQARQILLTTPDSRQWWRLISFQNFKEAFAMSRLSRVMIAALLVIVIIVFGGGGAVAFAAQTSLPAEPFYGIKLAIEDARLSNTSDPSAAILLSEEYAARRIDEMVRLAATQHSIPPELLTRLDSHLTQALSSAAGLDTPQASLEQILQMAETQSMILTQARSMTPNDPSLEKAAQYLEIARGLAQMGLSDPIQFREQMLGQNVSPMPPSALPTVFPSSLPSMMPSVIPSMMPSAMPTMMPSALPSMMPSALPSMMPSALPSMMPSAMPTMMPTGMPGGGGGMGGSGGMPTMMPTGMPGGGGGMP